MADESVKHPPVLQMPSVDQGHVELAVAVILSDFAKGCSPRALAQKWNITESDVLAILRRGLAYAIQPEEKLEAAATELLGSPNPPPKQE